VGPTSRSGEQEYASPRKGAQELFKKNLLFILEKTKILFRD